MRFPPSLYIKGLSVAPACLGGRLGCCRWVKAEQRVVSKFRLHLRKVGAYDQLDLLLRNRSKLGQLGTRPNVLVCLPIHDTYNGGFPLVRRLGNY